MSRLYFAVVFVACAGTPDPPPLATGWVDVDGDGLRAELTRADNGTTRIVNFWATWCGPCLREIPTLNAYDDAHDNVDVSYVSVDHPSVRARGDAVLAEHGLTGRRVLHLGEPDPTATLQQHVQGWNNSVPVTLIISPDGQTVATYTYAVDTAILDSAIAKVTP